MACPLALPGGPSLHVVSKESCRVACNLFGHPERDGVDDSGRELLLGVVVIVAVVDRVREDDVLVVFGPGLDWVV